MANYATLKAAIQDVIKTNGNNEITGSLLQQSLLAMINSLGDGFQYMGVATVSTNPGTPDQRVFYLATEPGTYTNFGGLVVNDGECAILKYSTSWSKETTGFAAQAETNRLLGLISNLQFTIDGEISESFTGNLRLNGIKRFNLLAGRKYTFKATLVSSISAVFYFEIRDNNGTTVHSGSISSGNTQNTVTFVETTDHSDCYISVYSGVAYNANVEINTISIAEALGAFDNMEPGNKSAITSNIVARSIFEIFDLPYQVLARTSYANNYALLPSGLSVSNSNAQIDKFAVQAGQYLYLDLSKDNDSVYQFQNASNVPSSGINNSLINGPITNAAKGVVRVPDGATYLMISKLKTNTTNVVGLISSLSDDIIARIMGKTMFDFDFGTGNVQQYTVRTYQYPVVSGHEYFVDVLTDNNTVTTYFSTRTDSTHTVQTDLGTGIGSRQFRFKATGDAPLFALSYRTAGAGSIYHISITDLTEISVYKNHYDIEDLQGRIGGGIALPDYSKNEQLRLYNLLSNRAQLDVHIVAFNTDQHFNIDNDAPNSGYNPKWVMQGVQALINIANLLPLDEIVFGGDAPGYGGSGPSFDAVGILQTICFLLQPTHDVNSVVVSIPGNHDAFQNNADVTAQGMYNVHGKRNQRHLYFVGNGTDNCDGYVDDKEHKIRTIYVDTYSRNTRTEDFRVFLANALSTLPTGYNALIFSHNPLTDEFAGIVKAQKISDPTVEIDAFDGPTDCHAILNQYATKIIACINGHTHFDAYGVSDSGILYIETTCACPHTRNYTTQNIPNTATLNTVTDTSFDVFIIDQNALTIEALRYGQGCNRKWVYKGSGIGQMAGYPQTIVR